MNDLTKERTAQARVGIFGTGFTTSKLDLGVNVASVGFIEVRKNKLANPIGYSVVSTMDLDGHSGSLVVGFAASVWFYISDETFEILGQRDNVLDNGYSVDIQIGGTVIGSEKSDITINLINDQGVHRKVVDLYDIKVSGIQVAGTSVRGKLKKDPSTLNRERRERRKTILGE
ncbi:hypothetical protein ACMDCT_09705 [Halomonadaceae bacterium KBTZ08]